MACQRHGSGGDMATPFTHAVVDDMGEVIKKYRWTAREYKWFKDNNPSRVVIILPKEKVEVFNLNNYEECLF